jgi:hypothetical protein
MKTVYLIFDPYKNGYYDGMAFRGILFAKKYWNRDVVESEVRNILQSSNGTTFLKIEEFYTN